MLCIVVDLGLGVSFPANLPCIVKGLVLIFLLPRLFLCVRNSCLSDHYCSLTLVQNLHLKNSLPMNLYNIMCSIACLQTFWIASPDMPTSRHCFPGDLPPKSRRLDENPEDFNQPSICIRYKLFLTFYIPYFAGYKSHRSVSRTGHFQFFFFVFFSDLSHR